MPENVRRKKLLFIAPLPPPITGQSLASRILLNELKRHYHVDVIDFNKGDSVSWAGLLPRMVSVLGILKSILVKVIRTDIIYLTISQSVAGNLKDILTYLICLPKLNRMLIHLHGGGIGSTVFERYNLLAEINGFFLKRLGGTIVLGPSLVRIFEGRIDSERVHIVPNFSEEYLFLNEQEIEKKFADANPLRFLFLSNMIDGKGHNELLASYRSLDPESKREIELHYAGDIQSKNDEKRILQAAREEKTIFYHGIVTGEEKRKLLASAHVFCLPTYYPYEGQPISILEAYASGCVVVTTDQGGIGDIFENNINGFLVEKQSSESIRSVMRMILEKRSNDRGGLARIAIFNREHTLKNFRVSFFVSSVLDLVKSLEA